MSAHGVEAWNITNPKLQKALQYADKILAVSNHTKNRLLKEYNLDSSKVYFLPNTFSEEQFNIQNKTNYLLKKYEINERKKIILTVARLSSNEQYKGYDKIISALPKIKQVIPNIHYILVGKGDDMPRIKKIIEESNLSHNITLTGFIPEEELSDHYNLCDIFAMPSKGEGFGIVYLEAMACGKPVLAGNQDGAIDALCQGKLGALVNPDNINEIAQTIIQILQGKYPNPLIYQPEELRKKVIDIFGFESFKNTLSVYLQDYFITKK